jgi:hypothetical protein
MSERFEIEGATLRVELPACHDTAGTRRHPLLLVLTPSLQASDWANSLHAEGILPEMIVVTAESGGKQNPAGWIAALSERYRLLESPAARWICGAGHDGVTAFRAVLDHPELFGAAACLSTSFEGEEGAPPLHSAMLNELESRGGLPAGLRVCFDYGSIGLDECYEPYHRDLGSILRGKSWCDGKEFTITRSVGGSHDLASWQKRLGPALRWLAGR